MRGYLLDTNIIAFWYNSKLPEHSQVVLRINSLDPRTPLRISAITWGEIEYGHQCAVPGDSAVQVQFRQFIETSLPNVLDLHKTTAIYYPQIRTRLFKKFAPKHGRKSLRPEQLLDPVTAMALGIQENDLWIAAQAVERNLVLVTHDSMDRIKDVTSDLLDFEDWAA